MLGVDVHELKLKVGDLVLSLLIRREGEGRGRESGSGFETGGSIVFYFCWSKSRKDRERATRLPASGRPDAWEFRIGARRRLVDSSVTRQAVLGTKPRRWWVVGTGAYSPGDSNMKVTTSPVSSAFMVMMSSLPAHLSILDC